MPSGNGSGMVFSSMHSAADEFREITSKNLHQWDLKNLAVEDAVASAERAYQESWFTAIDRAMRNGQYEVKVRLIVYRENAEEDPAVKEFMKAAQALLERFRCGVQFGRAMAAPQKALCGMPYYISLVISW